MYSFRTAKKPDIPLLQEIFLQSIRGSCHDDYSHEQIRVWTASIDNRERWHELVTTQHTVLIEVDEAAAGFASLRLTDYLDFMYMRPAYQGKGLAKALLEEMTKWAVDMGAADLYTHASITARGFFTSQGFSVIDRNVVERDGIEMVNYAMEKALNGRTPEWSLPTFDDPF